MFPQLDGVIYLFIIDLNESKQTRQEIFYFRFLRRGSLATEYVKCNNTVVLLSLLKE